MRRSLIWVASVALAFVACTKVGHQESCEIDAPGVYRLSLNATLDTQTKGVTFSGESGISSQFEEGDKVYVYNETKKAYARVLVEEDYKLAYLQPSSISDAGRSCVLEGELSFYKFNDDTDEWELVAPEDGDTYSLYYQMNDPDYEFGTSQPRYVYTLLEDGNTAQDGSASSVSGCDFAEATGISINLSGNTLTVPSTVRFANLQSMFRQRLTFTKGGAIVDPVPTISKLTIETTNETLVDYYWLDKDDGEKKQTTSSFDIFNPVITSDGDIYLSLAFYYTASEPAEGDQLVLTAVDTEGNVFQCKKDVPVGGFQKGRYYFGNCEMEWDHQSIKPTVTRSDGGGPDELEPGLYYDGQYDFTGNPMRITISGDCQGYRFYFNDNPGFVTLTGSGDPVSALWSENNAFIESDEDLTVILDCNYFIDNSADFEKAIDCGGELKLMTTGRTQTLTVITNDDGTNAYGIYGDSNFDAWRYDFSNISNLAVDGFTVSCPGSVDNQDGTFTWVYTVTPNS